MAKMPALTKGNAKKPKKIRKVVEQTDKMEKTTISGITHPAIRRMARRAGVKRLRGVVYPATQDKLIAYLDELTRGAVIFTKMGGRKTVTAPDVGHMLELLGRPMFM